MRFIAKESSAETIGKQWMADKCGYRDGVRNMNTDVGAELRSRLRARSGSATGCHRQVIHYRPPCGARNFLLAAASQNFDRCTFRTLPSSAAGGGRLSDCHLHKFRLAASDVSARCRLAVPEISLLATARKISTAARFAPCLLPLPAADVCRNVIYINFVLRHPMYRLAAALRCPKFLCSLPLREISTAARFTPCLLPPPAADVCQTVIYINFVLRHPMYRLAAALRCPKFLCSLPLREISTAARFTPCLLPPPAADICRNVIYINFVLRHPMYRLAAALRCPKFLCSLPLREISTAARFTPCLLPPPAAARRETPFKSKQKSTSMKCSPNRDSFSPAGSVRVGYGRPPDCHSLPSALRCPKFLARCRSRNFDRCTFRALPSSAAGGGRLSDCHLHKFRLAASDVSARCRLAVPEISLLAAAREISTAARFTPCLLPPQAAAGRETPFKSKQKSTSAKCFSLLAAE